MPFGREVAKSTLVTALLTAVQLQTADVGVGGGREGDADAVGTAETRRRCLGGGSVMLTRRAFVVATGLVPLAGKTAAHAEASYPSRTIRIMVGYPAGGGVDLVARVCSPIR